MILSFFAWAWQSGHVSAGTLLSLRSVAPPEGSTGVAQPQPYKRWEVQELWRTLDERWPRLPPEDAARRLRRWQEGRSPYSRMRSHAIHLQLEAIIALAISCVMRRAEIYSCSAVALDPDNAFIVARRSDDSQREVPHTRMSREAIDAWLRFRRGFGLQHHRTWLNLWAENTVTRPMSEHVFAKVLGTYVGTGWTFRRLRDTGAVEWLRAGLPIQHLQYLLGHRSAKDTLVYVEAVDGGPQRRLEKAEPLLARRAANASRP